MFLVLLYSPPPLKKKKKMGGGGGFLSQFLGFVQKIWIAQLYVIRLGMVVHDRKRECQAKKVGCCCYYSGVH